MNDVATVSGMGYSQARTWGPPFLGQAPGISHSIFSWDTIRLSEEGLGF